MLLTKHMVKVQDIGQRTLLHTDWSFSCLWFIVISAQEYQKRNLCSFRHFFCSVKFIIKEFVLMFISSRLDWLRYFAGGICILLARVNKFCWFRRIFVLYYCIESNITMQPTPYFPRSILTVIKVTRANNSLTLCCWWVSTLRCRSYPNLKELARDSNSKLLEIFTDWDKKCIERAVINKGDWKADSI